MEDKGDKKILQRISEITPWPYRVVQNVFNITDSYDATIEICEVANALNKLPEMIAQERFGFQR